MPGLAWLTSNSLQVLYTNITPGGPPVEFTIYYASFVAQQNLTVTGSPAINEVGIYTLPDNSVPEPGTLFLLGAGLITAGIFCRRMGKS